MDGYSEADEYGNSSIWRHMRSFGSEYARNEETTM